MEAEEKLIEILLKISNGMYTRFDGLEDFGIAIIELNIKNSEERKRAKLALSSAREKAERLYNDNNNKNIS